MELLGKCLRGCINACLLDLIHFHPSFHGAEKEYQHQKFLDANFSSVIYCYENLRRFVFPQLQFLTNEMELVI